MGPAIQSFGECFQSLTGRSAYPWQLSLAESPQCCDRLVRIPTGFGKTLGVLAAWLYHRVVRGDDAWPRRLVWTLPMRVLVEQTEREVRSALARLGLLWTPTEPHAGKVGVHALMGGSDAGEWHLFPEECAVLIGTQDMLLSRAMNRGYGAARARWPAEFGLLSQDVLWVLDEVQLMDVGLATAAQLASFRHADQLQRRELRPAVTWAMSATLQREWLKKSPDTVAWESGLLDVELGQTDRQADLWANTTKPLHVMQASTPRELAAQVARKHGNLPGEAPLTLVVANTVDRAREIFLALRDELGAGDCAKLHLLHSRFRGKERQAWDEGLLGPRAPRQSRIVVATQVIEAGVDLSADLLFTELCPWPSLIQRWGRLARRGGSGEAYVIGLDIKAQAAPYDPVALEAAWGALKELRDVSPRELAVFEGGKPGLLAALYPYDPSQVLLKDELDELFDTTPDLSGADLDVSRYIRSGDERDLGVFWVERPQDAQGRSMPPDATVRPTRAGTCAVPFQRARDWLCGKKTGAGEPQRLKEGVGAWVWDYLDGAWRKAQRKDLWPGQTVLVDATVGGYDLHLGWDGESTTSVPVVDPVRASTQEMADAAQDRESLSEAAWQTVGFHGGAVANEVGRITTGLLDERLVRILMLAARWHDLGKAHPAFQGAIGGLGRPARRDLAKAPQAVWRHGRSMYTIPAEEGARAEEVRPGFRHELASTLALFAVLQRGAPPEHPSRLGNLADLVSGAGPVACVAPESLGSLEREVLDLSADDFDLLAFLVCSHHGKLRMRLHGSPADQAARLPGGRVPLRGVCDGDVLPATGLLTADGVVQSLPDLKLSLEPAILGLSPSTGRSWAERVDGLARRHGLFALAWMEAVLRAADVRASRDHSLVDPALKDLGQAV